MAYEYEYELEDEFEGELEDEMEGEFEEEMEDEAGLEGEGWLSTIGNIAGSLLGESEEEFEGELEMEDEFEDEDEAELSPIRKIYPDAMMEHLGELAAEAESEDEAAEHFLPLVGMAASKLLPVVAKAIAPSAKRALPHIAKAVSRATPHLTKAVGKVARILHHNPKTRHLLRTVPGIARRTVGQIARHAAHGRPVSPHHAVRTLARQAKHVLGTPSHRVHALRRHHHLERRLHGRLGRRMTGVHHGRHHHHTGRHFGRSGFGVVPGRRGVGGVPGVYRRGVRGIGVAGHQARAGHAVGSHCQCAISRCGCCGQFIR
jgi:hypothetical protein